MTSWRDVTATHLLLELDESADVPVERVGRALQLLTVDLLLLQTLAQLPLVFTQLLDLLVTAARILQHTRRNIYGSKWYGII